MMKSDPSNIPELGAKELQAAYQTMTGFPAANDQLGLRLQRIADLMSRAGPLPPGPVLLWQKQDQSVGHVAVGAELIVGRQPGADTANLELPEDSYLGRRHFAIRRQDVDYVLEDLDSRNGIAVNDTSTRTQMRLLRDGDIIFAGDHIFLFLYRRGTA
jgi:FHA domain